MGLGKVAIKKQFPEKIIQKIAETKSSFHVKQGTTGKVQFQFLKSFLVVLTKLSF